MVHANLVVFLLERISRAGKFDTKEVDASLTWKDSASIQAIFACIQSIWNYQKRFTVTGSRGGFSSVFLVNFHPSIKTFTFECKNCPFFSEFTTPSYGLHGLSRTPISIR
jgi:hypothetical protein